MKRHSFEINEYDINIHIIYAYCIRILYNVYTYLCAMHIVYIFVLVNEVLMRELNIFMEQKLYPNKMPQNGNSRIV